jgi:hypothetical protein
VTPHEDFDGRCMLFRRPIPVTPSPDWVDLAASGVICGPGEVGRVCNPSVGSLCLKSGLLYYCPADCRFANHGRIRRRSIIRSSC